MASNLSKNLRRPTYIVVLVAIGLRTYIAIHDQRSGSPSDLITSMLAGLLFALILILLATTPFIINRGRYLRAISSLASAAALCTKERGIGYRILSADNAKIQLIKLKGSRQIVLREWLRSEATLTVTDVYVSRNWLGEGLQISASGQSDARFAICSQRAGLVGMFTPALSGDKLAAVVDTLKQGS